MLSGRRRGNGAWAPLPDEEESGGGGSTSSGKEGPPASTWLDLRLWVNTPLAAFESLDTQLEIPALQLVEAAARLAHLDAIRPFKDRCRFSLSPTALQ